MPSLLSSMPPSTDCSAATSCGGCRSYAGAVAVGRLNSSATATEIPIPSTEPTHERTPATGRGLVGEAPRLEHLFGLLLPPGTDNSRPAAAEDDVRNPARRC